ncbi:peptidylprolyl isomerase, partial [Gammaproteobacteria bacterium]|nr:peptidylprolyl isomerase [Gammaproteobacteria bacterium]
DGASFAGMVARYSDDVSARDSGGELGWLSDQELPPLIVNAIDGLMVGDVSEVIPTGRGAMLLKLLDERTLRGASDLLRARARASMAEEQRGRAYDEWLRAARDRTYISYIDPEIASLFRVEQ